MRGRDSASSGVRMGSAGQTRLSSPGTGASSAPRQQLPSDPVDLGLSSANTGSHLVFVVSPLLFENVGPLLSLPVGSITSAMIARLRDECPTNTTISAHDWISLAGSIFGLKEPAASHIFDVLFALGHPNVRPEQRLEGSRVLLGKMGGSVDEQRWSASASGRVVSLPALTLFLMAQQFLERPPRAHVGEVSADGVLTYVKQHLHDMVSAITVTKPGKVTAADAQELQLLLREFANGVEQPFGTSIGFLWTRSERTIDVAVLTQFLRPRIVLAADVTTGSRSNNSSGAASFPNNVVVRGVVSGVSIQPAPMLPPSSGQGSAANGASAKFLSATYKIQKCAQSSFYVTSELPNTTLSQLSNCHVALGPIAGVLTIDRCENTNISALCGAVVVTHCRNVTLFVCSNSPPVLAEGATTSDEVRLAPYNTHYSTLEEHLQTSGINPRLNLWRCQVPGSQLLPPAEFTSVSFPIAPQAAAVVTTRTNPCVLPKPYLDALQGRVERFKQTTSVLNQAYHQLEAAGRKDLAEALRGKVHRMFLDWVYDNGQAKGLVELLHQGSNAK